MRVPGRSLSALASSQIVMNPDLPEAHTLRGWYDSEGRNVEYNQFTSDGSSGGGGKQACVRHLVSIEHMQHVIIFVGELFITGH